MTLQLDGNDSDDWLLKVTDRQSDGSASIITTFDAYEDIPQEYQDYLRELNLPREEIEYILDFNDGARLHDGERIFDGAISVNVYTPDNVNPNSQGALLPYEYSGRTSAIGADPDLEAANTFASTIAFTATNNDDFIFHSISLANDYMMTGGVNSRSDLRANTVTVNGYDRDELVETVEIDLTFQHITHDLGWEGVLIT
ncbi:hypothetical protein CLV80_11268 [Yoonia maritima]|uniref:Uncharacterized protein n=1 Tax=Yoonia maritima TaxID=1435347 RepID=A0A2T0VV85_9RHOB|nr:hypothetical protein [Yoonia maritima]PRY75481.1 hypothetical protein CLV80_11268 [Yoonia maritima]